MRQIKFRGLRVDNNEWVYGGYVKGKSGNHYIFQGNDGPDIVEDDCCLVHPETVCQSTGLKDKNGKEIFEDDKMKKPGNKNVYTVVQFDAAFYLSHKGVNHRLSWTTNDGEIIGTIHDGKEVEG